MVVILSVSLQIEAVAASERSTDGDLFVHAPEDTKIVTDVPVVALEAKLILMLSRPNQAGPQINSPIVNSDSCADGESWQDLPCYH